ncbi:MAG: dodecin family protein [Desulfobacterales bacterium]
MNDSVYKVITLVGSSSESWEKAAAKAVEVAAGSLRDLRIAEVEEFDLQIENGKILNYRVKVRVSFRYQKE